MVNLNSPYITPIPYGISANDDVIYRYHSSSRPTLYFINEEETIAPVEQEAMDKNKIYLGVEIEFDSRSTDVGYRQNKINLIHESNRIFGNNTFAYYMNDGSLTHGLEMITQPATFEAHREIITRYAEVFNMIKEHGFKSDSYSTCGFHIHFNRNYFDDNPDLYTVNLLYLVEKFWRELVLMSRRNYDKLERWAGRYNDKPEKIVDDMKKGFYHRDRYKAINLTNPNTIEFRIYKGTLVPEYFMAIMELTNNLIICAKTKTPEELQSLEFSSLITSENLKSYYKLCHRKSNMNKLPYFLKEEKESAE